MNQRFALKFLIGLCLGMMLAGLVAFNTMLVWVATGPRSLEKLRPYLERSLVGESEIQARIGEAWLIWGGWQHPMDITLKEVTLATKEGQVFSSFPEISLGLDVLSLPFGQVLPASLSVTKPIISIKQNADKNLSFGDVAKPSEEASSGDVLAALIEALINPKSTSSLRKLRNIELLNADVSIGNEQRGIILSAPATNFVIRKESSNALLVTTNTVLHYAEQQTPLMGRFMYNKRTKRLEGEINVSKIYLAMISDLLAVDPALSGLQFPMSGKVGFAFTQDGGLDALKFNVTGGRGKIIHERLDGELPVRSLRVIGSATNGLKNITIDQANIDFAGSPFIGKLQASNTEKGWGVTGEVGIADVEISQAHLFWPMGLAPLTREWVTGNIRDGGITRATAKLNIQPGDLILKYLPKEAVDAVVELRDTKIKYMDGHPEVRGVNALVKVDGLSLNANITSASAFKDTKLSAGHLTIADLNPDNPLIELSMHADAAASDIVTLLGLPMLEHAKHLNLVAEKATGRASGDAKIGFYFFAKDTDGNEMPLTYKVQAKVNNVSSPAFLKRFDVENANGDFYVDEKEVIYSGAGVVNGANITSGKVRYVFTPEKGIDTTIEAAATVNDAVFKRFGVSLPMKLKENVTAHMEAALSTTKESTRIERFSMKGEGVNILGNAELTPDGNDVEKLIFDKLQYKKTNLSKLEYSPQGTGFSLHMKGEALDASPLFEDDGEKKEGDGFSFAHFPLREFSIDVGTFYGASLQQISKLQGSMSCSEKRCQRAEIKGKIGDQSLKFAITSEGKNRKISGASGDAGAVMKALGVTDSMEGGALSLNGIYNDAADELKGELRIQDYTLKNAPVLTKILSLASITGFLDTLAGNGISFKKLVAPFALKGDVITLKDAKTFGSAMGMSAEGTITFPGSRLQLEGTIVPSYTLNNVVGNVPLLGTLLTGGEGEGVFAARYSMKGSGDDPEVFVNPLSILTPGFLRNMFDIF